MDICFECQFYKLDRLWGEKKCLKSQHLVPFLVEECEDFEQKSSENEPEKACEKEEN